MIPITSRIGVKKIIRGSVTFDSEADKAVTISTIDPAKAVVILQTNLGSNSDSGDSGYSRSALYVSRTVALTSTKLTISSTYFSYESSYDTYYTYGTCTYQIIEYY